MNKDIKRLDLNTPDGAQLNMDALYKIAPSVFTESRDEKTGVLKRVVNFDALRQLLGDNAVDESRETYEFRWVGKDAAKSEAARAIDKTLRPVVEDSVDWDTTKNLYIEGDNLEVLKLLQRSYMGKVKMIYIDPPYNTGNDLVYHDYFDRSKYEEELASGAIDELGLRYLKSSENDSRFHSNWCSMIYPRLMVARSLLSEDGVMAIQIDDNEFENLKKICDEIFGQSNFISSICVKMSHLSGMKMSHKDKKVPKIKEYILIYAKYIQGVKINEVLVQGKWENVLERYNQIILNYDEDINSWKYTNLSHYISENKINEDKVENFRIENAYRIFRTAVNDSFANYPKDNIFRNEISKQGLNKIILNREEVLFASSKITTIDGKKVPAETIGDIWTDIGINNLHKEGDIQFPNGKKPLKLIERIIKMFSNRDSIILDFFSGSSTTAHSLFLKNVDDNGTRQFIMVQIAENLDRAFENASVKEKSNIRKQIEFCDSIGKPHTICELGKERIRRAGKKIKEEHPEVADTLDTGFRVLRLDDSNFNPGVKASPSEYDQQQLDLFANNIKTDRTDLDLLFGSILAWGLQLDLPMETEKVDGCKIYIVNDGDLVACFAEKVTDKVIEAMAEKEPLRVLFRDSCFDSDDKKINIFETFKQKLDWTDDEAFNNIRVI